MKELFLLLSIFFFGQGIGTHILYAWQDIQDVPYPRLTAHHSCTFSLDFTSLVLLSKSDKLLQVVKSSKCTAFTANTKCVVTYQSGQNHISQGGVWLPNLQKISGQEGRRAATSPTELQQQEE